MTALLADGARWLRTHTGDLMSPEVLGLLHSELRGQINYVVTSPPYKRKDGLTLDLISRAGQVCANALAPGGLVFLNFAQLSEDFAMPYKVYSAFAQGSGLPSGQTFVWVKSIALGERTHGHLQAINSDYVESYCWEYVWAFYKPPKPKLDRLAVGVPYTDKSNLKRGTRGKNGDLRPAGDAWYIPYETTGKTTKKKHPHEYPESLVERCLRIAGAKPGEVVLDPFMGSGTTLAVAKRMGLDGYGIEIDPERVKVARDRWCDTETKPGPSARKPRFQARKLRPDVFLL